MKRILYIQYTNPAGYPPLEHSSRILAEAGWQVLFLGTYVLGADALCFPLHANVRTRMLAACRPGPLQKLHYFFFGIWVLMRALVWRPSWIYASEPLACPTALVLGCLPGMRVLYHEHDSPGEPVLAFQRLVHWARQQVARRAACCVLPNEDRLKRFQAETGTRQPVFCVWNCPSNHEVAPPREPAKGSFWLLYHGSIVPARLPLAVLRALARLPERVKLRVIGYETAGSIGYTQQLREFARQLGVQHRLEIVGVLPRRLDLMAWCRRCDAGLALMPLRTTDGNERNMAGASNKAFDYLASGLPLVVSDLPDWRAAYVEPGYGVACDPDDPDSIARSVRRFVDEPDLARSMGEHGRQRILAGWNYEACFQPLRQLLEA